MDIFGARRVGGGGDPVRDENGMPIANLRHVPKRESPAKETKRKLTKEDGGRRAKAADGAGGPRAAKPSRRRDTSAVPAPSEEPMAARGGKREARRPRQSSRSDNRPRDDGSPQPTFTAPSAPPVHGRGENILNLMNTEKAAPSKQVDVAHRDKTVRFRLNVPSGDESRSVRFRDEEDDGRHERGDMTHRDGPSRNDDDRRYRDARAVRFRDEDDGYDGRRERGDMTHRDGHRRDDFDGRYARDRRIDEPLDDEPRDVHFRHEQRRSRDEDESYRHGPGPSHDAGRRRRRDDDPRHAPSHSDETSHADHAGRGGHAASWRSRDDGPPSYDSRDGYYQRDHNRYRDGAHVEGSPIVSGSGSPHSGGGRSFMGALAAMNVSDEQRQRKAAMEQHQRSMLEDQIAERQRKKQAEKDARDAEKRRELEELERSESWKRNVGGCRAPPDGDGRAAANLMYGGEKPRGGRAHHNEHPAQQEHDPGSRRPREQHREQHEFHVESARGQGGRDDEGASRGWRAESDLRKPPPLQPEHSPNAGTAASSPHGGGARFMGALAAMNVSDEQRQRKAAMEQQQRVMLEEQIAERQRKKQAEKDARDAEKRLELEELEHAEAMRGVNGGGFRAPRDGDGRGAANLMYRADAAPPSGGERHRSRRQPQPQPEDEQPPYDATEESPRPSFSTIDPAMDPQGPPPHRRPRDRSSKNSPKPEPEVQEPPPPAPRGEGGFAALLANGRKAATGAGDGRHSARGAARGRGKVRAGGPGTDQAGGSSAIAPADDEPLPPVLSGQDGDADEPPSAPRGGMPSARRRLRPDDQAGDEGAEPTADDLVVNGMSGNMGELNKLCRELLAEQRQLKEQLDTQNDLIEQLQPPPNSDATPTPGGARRVKSFRASRGGAPHEDASGGVNGRRAVSQQDSRSGGAIKDARLARRPLTEADQSGGGGANSGARRTRWGGVVAPDDKRKASKKAPAGGSAAFGRAVETSKPRRLQAERATEQDRRQAGPGSKAGVPALALGAAAAAKIPAGGGELHGSSAMMPLGVSANDYITADQLDRLMNSMVPAPAAEPATSGEAAWM